MWVNLEWVHNQTPEACFPDRYFRGRILLLLRMTVPIWGLLPVGVRRMWLVLQVAFVYGAHHTGEKCEISSWRDQAEILAVCDSVVGEMPSFL